MQLVETKQGPLERPRALCSALRGVECPRFSRCVAPNGLIQEPMTLSEWAHDGSSTPSEKAEKQVYPAWQGSMSDPLYPY